MLTNTNSGDQHAHIGLKLQTLTNLGFLYQEKVKTLGQESATVNFSYIRTHWLI